MLHPDCSLPYQSAAQGCRSRLLLKAAADRGRLPSSRKQVARVEHEMSFGGVCMSITTYLNDFDTDLETKRVLGPRSKGLVYPSAWLTSSPTESSPDESSNLPGPASGIPMFCAK